MEMLDWMKQAKTLAEDPVNGFDPDAVTESVTVDIDAPARIVWDILCDMPRYNEWNPFCVKAVSELKMGAAVDMRLMNYAAPGSIVPNCEYICALDKDRMISWEMVHTDAWPYPVRRDQVITSIGFNSCRYYSIDAFLGNNGIHVYRFAGPWVKRAFDDSAYALKARAEAFFAAEN